MSDERLSDNYVNWHAEQDPNPNGRKLAVEVRDSRARIQALEEELAGWRTDPGAMFNNLKFVRGAGDEH